MKRIFLFSAIFLMTLCYCTKKAQPTAENAAPVDSEESIEKMKEVPVPTAYGVVIADNVNMRSEPKKDALAREQLFKGNKLGIIKFVKGDPVDGNDSWAEITADYLYETVYVHSSFIKSDKEAEAYLKGFSYDEQFSKLKEDFSSSQIEEIRDYRKSFDAIKTAEDLAAVYKKAVKLQKDLSPVIEKKYEKQQNKNPEKGGLNMAWIYNLMPGLFISYVAEGTVASFFFTLDTFEEKAKKTDSKADDDFVNIMKTAYGRLNITGYNEWFEYTWDYGGKSLLGTGIHLKILKMSDKALKNSELFKNEILDVKKDVIDDMTSRQIFAEDKDKLVSELNSIIKEVSLSDEDKKKIEQRISDINSNKPELQINCNKKECNYGG